MPTFAAVDIGSNSVRIKIARLAQHRLVPVFEDREVTRLGQAVFKTGQLSPAAMAHTTSTLQRFHKAAQKHGANVVRVVATSALRDARNGGAFIDWAKSATGWNVEVITGLEEARLIHLGLISRARFGRKTVLLVDLGGGSCELTISIAGHIRYTASLPLGAVRLTEEFLKHDPPTSKEMKQLRSFIEREMGRARRRVTAFRPRTVIATSGTAAALANIFHNGKASHLESEPVPRSKVTKIAKGLAKMKASQRTSLPGVGPRRAEIIVAGGAVFARLMEECRLPAFKYSPLGLRDGLLAQMAADYDRRTRSRRQIESDRGDAVLAAVKHYGVDVGYSRQVRDTALALFRRLSFIHGLPRTYQEWLSAAAMLHEVGIYMNRYGWHRHTYYVVAHSEIFGYTAYERLLIATITRYLGNSRPAASDRLMKLLAQRDRLLVPKAVLLLRMARALHQSRRAVVKSFSVRGEKETLRLILEPKRGKDAGLELWALEKERAYFRELFGRELKPAAS